MRFLMRSIALALFLLVAACATFNPDHLRVGDDLAKVRQMMGQPTAVHHLLPPDAPAIERLEYWRGPYVRATYMVDLDAAARVVRIAQVLTTKNFERIQIGQWTKEDVRRNFGMPAETGRVYNGDETWSYRYQDVWDLMYHIYFDQTGRVTRAHQGPDLWMECRFSIWC